MTEQIREIISLATSNLEKLAQLVREMKKIQEINQESIKILQRNQDSILKLIKSSKNEDIEDKTAP